MSTTTSSAITDEAKRNIKDNAIKTEQQVLAFFISVALFNAFEIFLPAFFEKLSEVKKHVRYEYILVFFFFINFFNLFFLVDNLIHAIFNFKSIFVSELMITLTKFTKLLS